MISGCPPGMYSLPPMARKSFFSASTSFVARCQWPIVTPAWLYGASCAAAGDAISVEAINSATNTIFFTDASLKTKPLLRCQNLRPQRRPLHNLDASTPGIGDVGDGAAGRTLANRFVELDAVRLEL